MISLAVYLLSYLLTLIHYSHHSGHDGETLHLELMPVTLTTFSIRSIFRKRQVLIAIRGLGNIQASLQQNHSQMHWLHRMRNQYCVAYVP